MRSVYKFTLETVGTELWFPADAQIVHIHEQSGNVCMWVLGTWEEGTEKFPRMFHVCGTGHKVSKTAVYVGTAHLVKAGLVLHVFEKLQ